MVVRPSAALQQAQPPSAGQAAFSFTCLGGLPHCQQRCLPLLFLRRSVTKELAPEWSGVVETCCGRLSCWQWGRPPLVHSWGWGAAQARCKGSVFFKRKFSFTCLGGLPHCQQLSLPQHVSPSSSWLIDVFIVCRRENLQRRGSAGESMREIRGDTAMRGKRAGAPRRGCLPERVPGVGRVGGARPIETGREECGREWCLLAKCSKPFENADPFFLRSFREPRRTALPFKPRSGTRPPSGYAGGGPRAEGGLKGLRRRARLQQPLL